MKISDTEIISGHTILGFGKAHPGETYKDIHTKLPQYVHWVIKTTEESAESSRGLKHAASYFKKANKCQDFYGPIETKPNTASASAASSNNPNPRTNLEQEEMKQKAYQQGLAAGQKKKQDRSQKKAKAEQWDISSDPDISDMSDV